MLSHIQTVLFDLDGTLTVPVIDFDGLRTRLGLPEGVSIMHALTEVSDKERERAMAIVQEVELEAARNAQAAPGAVELIEWLDDSGFASGIITRNYREAVDITLDVLELDFDVVVTRDCAPPKPAPDAVFEALRRLKREASSALMVGDYQDDMLAGKASGTMTCLVTNGKDALYASDFSVPWLSALQELLQTHHK